MTGDSGDKNALDTQENKGGCFIMVMLAGHRAQQKQRPFGLTFIAEANQDLMKTLLVIFINFGRQWTAHSALLL